jgi:NAD(P)-dependent dehydrogenase (short-subunit alcohol dehydrogenase family)
MMNLNSASVVNTARAVVPRMIAANGGKGGGKIVSVAARAGLAGSANMGAYVASKSAVIRLTETMALELREHNINVNCVMPSIIDTAPNRADMPNADFSKWVSPAALADVIVFLASDAARAIHGAALPVSGLS